jgi:drug/metabolite transporter (DMT)-like permease
MSTTFRGALYGIAAAAIWGGMYVVSDVVLQSIPPFTLLTIRLVISVLVLGLILLAARRSFDLPRRDLALSLGIGLIGFGLSLGAQFVGTDRSTAVNGALITSASPAFILIFAAWLLREKLTIRQIVSVVVASIGVLIIIDPTNADFSSDAFFGNVMLALAAVTWALYSVLVRRMSTRVDTTLLSFVMPIGGLIVTIPASAIEVGTRPVDDITPGIVLGILYLGVISTALAMWLWNRSFALVPASTASLFFFAQPLVGTVLAALLLGQQVTSAILVGGALIAGGVLLSIAPASNQAHTN